MNEQMNEWVGVLHTVTLTLPSAAGPNCKGGRAPLCTPEQGSAENSHHWDEGAEGGAGGTHAMTTRWPARPAWPGCWQPCPLAETCPIRQERFWRDGELPPSSLHQALHVHGGGCQGPSGLTMPFCTLKPSWYLRSGRLMRTVVTGGQLTMLSFTCVWFFRPCRAGMGGPVGLRCRWEDNLRGLGG